jgi:hypothetical protein
MTEYIQNDKKCNYLDFGKYPSNKMLNNCIFEENKQPCTYQINTQMFNTNIENRIFSDRGLVDGDYIKENYVENKINKSIEGFVSGPGPGELQVEGSKCPETYVRCPVTGLCVQACRNCKLPTGKSLYMNEYDKCFPNGVFNGYDNNGNLKCTCGKDNEYCSDKKNIFTVDGILFN